MPKRAESENEDVLAQDQIGQETTQESDDATWETLMELKGTGGGNSGKDSNGFDKMNTNFYLKDGEEAEIMFLKENPFLFLGHGLKLYSKAGRAYYTTEACQKSKGASCSLCDSKNENVSAARHYVGFTILDGRGKFDNSKKDFDGAPHPMIFLTSVAFAKIIKRLRDDLGGEFKNYVIKINKDGKNYSVNPVLIKQADKTMVYKTANLYKGEIPAIEDIYAPSADSFLSAVLGHPATGTAAAPAAGKPKGGF